MLGLLPWLVTGARLPLQSIWESPVPPEAMPIALLPLSQYDLVLSMAMVVIGAALAGLAVRIAATRGTALPPWWTWSGAAIVQVGALTQAASALSSGIEDSTRSRIYQLGMVAAVLVAVAIGLAVMMGVGRARPGGVAIAGTVAAIAFGQWLSALAAAVSAGTAMPIIALRASTWLPVLIVGVLVGWSGAGTVRRAAASAASLLALWIAPAAITAVMYALGSRVYLQSPQELWPAGREVFVMALGSDGGAPQRLLVAAAVAVVVGAGLRTARRRVAAASA